MSDIFNEYGSPENHPRNPVKNNIMSRPSELEADGTRLCEKCGERPGETEFYWDMLEATHGFGKWWCQRCVLTTQLKFCQDQAAKIPDILNDLRKLDAKE